MTVNVSSSTRERILAAAATTLSERGYARAHLTEIARLARLQPPAVYHYFSSREELVEAVLVEGQQIVRDHVEAAIVAAGSSRPARELVGVAVEAHLRCELELSDFARAVSRNAGHLPAHLRAELDRGSRAFHEVWRGLLARADSEGSLRRETEPRVARMLVIGALNWATEWWQPGLPVDDVVATARRLVDSALFA